MKNPQQLIDDALNEINANAEDDFSEAAKKKIRELVLIEEQIAKLKAKRTEVQQDLRALQLSYVNPDILGAAPTA